MLHRLQRLDLDTAFSTDCYRWFSGEAVTMERWQYLDPAFERDRVRGSQLWAQWEGASGTDNMLHRQGRIIRDYAGEMVALAKRRTTLIDLGPGSRMAATRNTIPFLDAYGKDLERFISVDISSFAASDIRDHVQSLYPEKLCFAVNDDFLEEGLPLPAQGACTALLMGGTIGNIAAPQGAAHATELMADRIRRLKFNLPAGTVIFIGLEATQDADLLYDGYDHPAHAEFEINLMHGIKRDVLSNEHGFDPDQWRYAMKWWPDSYQFCHLAEAIKDQEFSLMGRDFRFAAGDQLVIDNSFKFPVLAMQRATQLAGSDYLLPFADQDGRMVVHTLRL